MPVTPSQTAIDRLGRMVAASVTPTLTDEDLADALVMYALLDANSVAPGGGSWVETYDFNGAAAEAWGWKKAKASATVTFNADGSQFSMAELSANCQERIDYYQSLRQIGNISVGAP